MKLATWNVNSLKVRLPHVLTWLEANPVDVLCLQELKLEQSAFPLDALQAAGYTAVWHGQKTYNGVAILTRLPHVPADALAGMPDFPDVQSRVIAATVADIRVICAYFVNGEAVGSDKYQYKLAWLAALQAYVAQALQTYQGRVVLLGDFNIAPADLDVYDPAAWQDKILCSAPERAHFAALQALGMTDAFRQFHAEEPAYSWWDYRAAMFRRNLGLRIDHILYGPALASLARDAWIDKTPRGWERPSDHAPVCLALATED